MRTGLSLMFAKRFWGHWFIVAGVIPGGMGIGCLMQHEHDKEAYAMRGRTNMFKADYELLKKTNPSRELWQ